MYLINFLRHAIFLLFDSPASEFYIPAFQNTLFYLHSRKNNRDEIIPAYTAYKDGTDYSETSAYKIQRSGNHPKERIPHLDHSEKFSDTMQRLRFLCPQNAVYFVTSSFSFMKGSHFT